MGRAVAALAFALALVGATTVVEAQTPYVVIDDVRQVERDAGIFFFNFTVTLVGTPVGTVDVDWQTNSSSPATGSATPGTDYLSGSGTVQLSATSPTATIQVRVLGDTDAGDAAAETFVVDLTSITPNATFRNKRGVGTILDDDRSDPEVSAFSVVAEAADDSGDRVTNRLQWRVPVGDDPVDEVLVRYQLGNGCTPPNNPNEASGWDGEFRVTPTPGPAFAPEELGRQDHTGLEPGKLVCYSIWARYGASYGARTGLQVRPPLDPQGKTRWAFALPEGSTLLSAPTVGVDAIYTVDENGVVHALRRGLDPSAGAGLWPDEWRPVDVGRRSHYRSSLLPLPEGPRYIVATEDGEVHAVNGRNGSLLWKLALFPVQVGTVQAPMAGIFTAFGGFRDLVLVGTSSASNNYFWALNPQNGDYIDSFPGLGDTSLAPGPMLGMATVDYAARRVYFTSRGVAGSPEHAWALDIGTGADVFTLAWKKETGLSSSATVYRGNRVYHGDDTGRVWALDAAGVQAPYSYPTGDGAVKGLVFPDRRNGDLYVTTTNKVWKVVDDGASLVLSWDKGVSTASFPLFYANRNELYVGDKDGKIFQFETANGDQVGSPVEVEAIVKSQVGAPALDTGFDLLLVGSGNHVFAVQVPLQ